jgi:hypothetical protein
MSIRIESDPSGRLPARPVRTPERVSRDGGAARSGTDAAEVAGRVAHDPGPTDPQRVLVTVTSHGREALAAQAHLSPARVAALLA